MILSLACGIRGIITGKCNHSGPLFRLIPPMRSSIKRNVVMISAESKQRFQPWDGQHAPLEIPGAC